MKEESRRDNNSLKLIRKQKRGQESVPILKSISLDTGEFPYFSYPLLEQTGMVKHCFTTRQGGKSQGIFASLNLSFTRGDEREAVEENFRRVSQVLDTRYDDFVFTDQTHTTNVRRVGKEDAGKGLVKERGYSDVDGLITNEPGPLFMQTVCRCILQM